MQKEKPYLQMLLKLVSINTGSLILYFLIAAWLEHRYHLQGIAFFGAMVLTLITCFYVLFKVSFKDSANGNKLD